MLSCLSRDEEVPYSLGFSVLKLEGNLTRVEEVFVIANGFGACTFFSLYSSCCCWFMAPTVEDTVEAPGLSRDFHSLLLVTVSI